jgi:hypothetical protein
LIGVVRAPALARRLQLGTGLAADAATPLAILPRRLRKDQNDTPGAIQLRRPWSRPDPPAGGHGHTQEPDDCCLTQLGLDGPTAS